MERRNNEYIMGNWKKLYPSAIVIIIILVFSVVSGNYSFVLPLLLGAVLAYVFLISKRAGIKNDLNSLFKNQSPELLVDYYEKIYNNKNNRIQDSDVWLVYNKALVLCYYGLFDEALAEMGKINWESKVPYIQSLELSIRALTNYLKPGNYSYGLSLSINMQNLGNVSVNVPGAKQTKEFYETYIEIGDLLTGNVSSSILDNLERKFKEAQFYPKLLIAWCLGKTYFKMGLMEKSEEEIEFCKQVAPYCITLQTIK